MTSFSNSLYRYWSSLISTLGVLNTASKSHIIMLSSSSLYSTLGGSSEGLLFLSSTLRSIFNYSRYTIFFNL